MAIETDAQMQTLATALRAETNQTVIDALAIRDDITLTNWCNSVTTTDAWNNSINSKELFQASDMTKFDGLSAGKRDAFRMMLDYAPHDMAKASNRKALQDIWGAADSVAVLTSCLRKALVVETYFGGTNATTNTVTGLRLTLPGQVSINDVSVSLNKF